MRQWRQYIASVECIQKNNHTFYTSNAMASVIFCFNDKKPIKKQKKKKHLFLTKNYLWQPEGHSCPSNFKLV